MNKKEYTIMPDTRLQAAINKELIARSVELANRVELAVQGGRVIAIGYMKNAAQCKEVIDIIKKVGGYNELINKVEVRGKPDTMIADNAATGKIKAFLLKPLNGINSSDYAVTTVGGVVYILGTAKSKVEEKKIVDYAKTVSGVNKVASYIQVQE